MLTRRTPRRGATLVESALVYPVLFLLLIGIVVISLLVFRKQQVTYLAREGARWAAVHGADYASESNSPATTAADVHSNAILPYAASMHSADLSTSVSWSNNDQRPTRTVVETINGVPTVISRSNTVTVTVSYNWTTGTWFGSFTLTGSSVATMQF